MNPIRTLAAAAVLALGSSALAGPVEVDFKSSETFHGKGNFTGKAFYDSTTDKLTVDITNTSKGVLTGIAFEVPKGESAKFETPAKSTKSHWRDERNRKGAISGMPFGTYQGGTAVNGQWGSTAFRAGLAAGHTGVFVFDVTGANASALTTADFFTGTKPQIVASFTDFKKSHFKNDRAGGFGTVITPPVTTNTISSNTPTPGATTSNPPGTSNVPILTLQPPPVLGGPITKPVSGPTGSSGSNVTAVPLPAAAPAGLAMLGLFGVVYIVRRLRAMTV